MNETEARAIVRGNVRKHCAFQNGWGACRSVNCKKAATGCVNTSAVSVAKLLAAGASACEKPDVAAVLLRAARKMDHEFHQSE